MRKDRDKSQDYLSRQDFFFFLSEQLEQKMLWVLREICRLTGKSVTNNVSTGVYFYLRRGDQSGRTSTQIK